MLLKLALCTCNITVCWSGPSKAPKIASRNTCSPPKCQGWQCELNWPGNQQRVAFDDGQHSRCPGPWAEVVRLSGGHGSTSDLLLVRESQVVSHGHLMDLMIAQPNDHLFLQPKTEDVKVLSDAIFKTLSGGNASDTIRGCVGSHLGIYHFAHRPIDSATLHANAFFFCKQKAADSTLPWPANKAANCSVKKFICMSSTFTSFALQRVQLVPWVDELCHFESVHVVPLKRENFSSIFNNNNNNNNPFSTTCILADFNLKALIQKSKSSPFKWLLMGSCALDMLHACGSPGDDSWSDQCGDRIKFASCGFHSPELMLLAI